MVIDRGRFLVRSTDCEGLGSALPTWNKSYPIGIFLTRSLAAGIFQKFLNSYAHHGRPVAFPESWSILSALASRIWQRFQGSLPCSHQCTPLAPSCCSVSFPLRHHSSSGWLVAVQWRDDIRGVCVPGGLPS
jgi:hypothetical protein